MVESVSGLELLAELHRLASHSDASLSHPLIIREYRPPSVTVWSKTKHLFASTFHHDGGDIWCCSRRVKCGSPF